MLKKIFFILCFIFIFNSLFAQDNVNQESIESLLEKAFVKTFNSAKEFRDCHVFRLLGYDLAETDLIGRITPHPVALTVKSESDNEKSDIASDTLFFSRITVSCDKIHYYNMIIEKAEFIFPNCLIDYKRLKDGYLRFLEADEIQIKVDVSETDVLSVFQLYAQAKSLSKLKMRFTPKLCRLTGRIKNGIFLADFEVKGNTKLLTPKTVDFVCDKLIINGHVQPRSFTSAVFAGINPVFDSSKIWLNLELQSINIIKGFVETKATIKRKTKN